MKLIFEMINGTPYLYTETESHFESVKHQRQSKQIDLKEIVRECDMSRIEDEDFHIVVDLYEKPKPQFSHMYVIMCNDCPQGSADSEEVALQRMCKLKNDYFTKNEWVFNKSYEKYDRQCHWYLEKVNHYV